MLFYQNDNTKQIMPRTRQQSFDQPNHNIKSL